MAFHFLVTSSERHLVTTGFIWSQLPGHPFLIWFHLLSTQTSMVFCIWPGECIFFLLPVPVISILWRACFSVDFPLCFPGPRKVQPTRYYRRLLIERIRAGTLALCVALGMWYLEDRSGLKIDPGILSNGMTAVWVYLWQIKEKIFSQSFKKTK